VHFLTLTLALTGILLPTTTALPSPALGQPNGDPHTTCGRLLVEGESLQLPVYYRAHALPEGKKILKFENFECGLCIIFN